ncbi:MAG TPA: glutamyl-tRNA reductase, partial [Acidimicrobiia bacterium]
MSLLVVGLNHRTVPVGLLERVAVAPEALPKALQALARREHLAEVVLLSTCNRTEIYAHATLFHPAMQEVRDFLADASGVDPDEFSDLLYAYHDDAAVAHLFGVAAGLDSMIIGEGEILGQVREAWQAAEREAAGGPMLSRTFRHAIEVGKRARTETAIGRHAVSVSSAAVALATTRLGSLDDRRVLVLGAGSMGEGMAMALAGAGVREIVVANRTTSRADELAARVGGRAITLEEIPAALTACDVLLASTGAQDQVRDQVGGVVRGH